MFENDRYLTRGVEEHIPLALQLMMWELIEEARKKVELDYLQVFNISQDNNNGLTRITHEQEQPEYRREMFALCGSRGNYKVFVIDDGSHSTMLLAEEY